MIIWCMPPEIRSATDRIFLVMFCFFIPITTRKIHFLKKWKNTRTNYPFTHLQQKLRSCYVWFLRYGAWHADFFVILGFFLSFYPPDNPENQNFWKTRKKLQEILSFHTCVPQMAITWYMAPKISSARDIFFSSWTIFWPLTQ